MRPIFDFFEIAGIVLQVLVLLFLLFRSSFRKYPLLLVYSVAQLAATIAEVVVSHGTNPTQFRRLYWTDEAILDLLLFLTVIALTFTALEGTKYRGPVGRMLGLTVLIVVAIPFIAFHPYYGSHWLIRTSQLLNFGGAIMTLALWSALLSSKKRDMQLLTVSAGLGIAVTGAAISYGARLLLPASLKDGADLLLVVTHLAAMVIWCWAFWPLRKENSSVPANTV